MPNPGANIESGPPSGNVETNPNQVVEGQVEVAPSPAVIERESRKGEATNQGQQMIVKKQQPLAVPADDDNSSDDNTNKSHVKLESLKTAPDLANDVDVIEKEWVDKAKQIVKETVDDPYKQNHNVSMLKADYMKKRYGKDIKVPNDAPAKA